MPRPPIDLARKIKDIVQHVQALPAEAGRPLAHYQRTSTDLWNSVNYVEKAFDQPSIYRAVADRHLTQINSMALISLIENFERFLKEIAANCIDHLAYFILDDRLNLFSIQGGVLASHFNADSLGQSLCESAVWLNCDEINKRFSKLLADPFAPERDAFHLFPKNNQQKPEAERWRFPVLALIWQIRHSVVHNVGVITQSDAVKLRLLAQEPVHSPRILAPTRDDLRYLKRFLDETAESCNRRVGERLSNLLSKILDNSPALFDAQDRANQVASDFGIRVTVAGKTGNISV